MYPKSKKTVKIYRICQIHGKTKLDFVSAINKL